MTTATIATTIDQTFTNTELMVPDCYVELRVDLRDGSAFFYVRHDSENSVPFDVWHGHVQSWKLSGVVDGNKAAEFYNEYVMPLMQRVIEGYTSVWNGNNHVAEFTFDAQNALYDITEIIDSGNAPWNPDEEFAGVWSASDYFSLSTPDQAKLILPATTDEELGQMASELDEEAAYGSVVLTNTLNYLIDIRDNIAEVDG